MLIKLVLILAVIGLLVLFVRSRPGVRLQAGKRVGVVVFALLNIYAVARPDDVSVVAQALGVGRGTDLVLYALVMAFLLGMLNFYVRFRESDRRFTELARTIAIREAESVNRERHLDEQPGTALTVPVGRLDEPDA